MWGMEGEQEWNVLWKLEDEKNNMVQSHNKQRSGIEYIREDSKSIKKN